MSEIIIRTEDRRTLIFLDEKEIKDARILGYSRSLRGKPVVHIDLTADKLSIITDSQIDEEKQNGSIYATHGYKENDNVETVR